MTADTPVHDIARSVPAPWSARQIASVAGVALPRARQRLDELVAADELVAFDRGEERFYYPDPVQATLDATGGPPADADERATVASVRERLAAWEQTLTVTSLDGLLRYHHAARLVTCAALGRGVDVYERDWDVLVVLDTCRTDALRAVVDRLDGVTADDVTEHRSLGSQTAEWLCATFTTDRREEAAETGYVSGNGWTKGVFEDGLRPDDDTWFRDLSLPASWDVLDSDDFGALVHAWQRARGEYSREVPWEPHPSPETVTDHAIAPARDRPDLDRLVVHYKQPHAPYTIRAEREGRTDLTQAEGVPFDYLAADGDRETVWEAYLTDLRAALDGVATLCRNVDGTIAITADHGEAFGEGGEYGHRPAMLHPEVRRVPWVTVEGTDEGTHDGDLSAYTETDRRVADQLDALGYR